MRMDAPRTKEIHDINGLHCCIGFLLHCLGIGLHAHYCWPFALAFGLKRTIGRVEETGWTGGWNFVGLEMWMVPCYPCHRFPQHPVGPCEKPLTKHSSRNAPGAMARTSRLLSLVLAAFAVATSLGVGCVEG